MTATSGAGDLDGGHVWKVAVPVPVPDTLDYLPPRRDWKAPPGVRVRVPFGRRRLIGVVMGQGPAAVETTRLRRVEAVLDEQPVLDRSLLDLVAWASRYYRHPIGEVVAAALPRALRCGRGLVPALPKRWRLCTPADTVRAALVRAPRQRALANVLALHPEGLSEPALDAEFPGWRPHARALAAKGLAEAVPDMPAPPVPQPPPRLNSQQAQAVAQITEAGRGFRVHLLDGVTGSGKTEVYLAAIRHTLEQGRQALVLVPEIGLTPQLLERFRTGLGVPVLELHSGLSDAERHRVWFAARSGRARVVVGTRSAVFVPLREPGLIVVDEEHDPSFKQQEGFRYHARDLAVVRGRQLGIPVVLGSATPSLESLRNVQIGRYLRSVLPRRAGAATPPRFSLVDLRRDRPVDGLSAALEARIRHHLGAGGQVLLFLNRRGFAPVLFCPDCGWGARCERCDARMTFHRADSALHCHHCGRRQAAPSACPACGGASLMPLGTGTERLEIRLRERFPEVSTIRVDRDTTRRKGHLEAALEGARSGRHRILVGTQMLSKGHHFPGVTLVGVVDADQGLYSTDFRATERLAQAVVQVAGRAGRAERPGEVVLQTHLPEHPLLQTLVHHGYARFAQAALEERRAASLPPWRLLAVLRAESASSEAPQALLARVAECTTPGDEVEILGPAPAPMERRAGRWRAQLLALSSRRAALEIVLDAWLAALRSLPEARRVRWSLDVDPQDLY